MELSSYNADFHIHSKYSGATSSRMVIETIAHQAKLKGLVLVGTGDIFHPRWFESVKGELVEVDEGTFEHPRYGTRFVLTAEVEDRNRVHHLLILPSLSTAESVREIFAKHSSDIDEDGRARIELAAPEIVDIAVSHGCIVGPCHAFTPWTSMYKEFDSTQACYGDSVGKIGFLELGLSADTYMADRIAELADLTFLSCSDAHSPWPDKLGREFNRFELSEPTYSEVIKGILRKNGRRISLNVGFDPRLGKYHRTACSRCFKQFELEHAKSLRWRCDECGGWIKKGVWDRVNELATYDEPKHPPHRPPYLRIAPLAEVIALALGYRDPHVPEVRSTWEKLVVRFGNEIGVLLEAGHEALVEVAGPRVAAVIKAFRENTIHVIPGGGGRYGRLELSLETAGALPSMPQRKLTEFG
ncbi:MAG: TIGR00375 family protein [Hadesarchaea archaeon]|nr:MAG: TIGR00375 family protein [Hadesarchaea archaeon]